MLVTIRLSDRAIGRFYLSVVTAMNGVTDYFITTRMIAMSSNNQGTSGQTNQSGQGSGQQNMTEEQRRQQQEKLDQQSGQNQGGQNQGSQKGS